MDRQKVNSFTERLITEVLKLLFENVSVLCKS